MTKRLTDFSVLTFDCYGTLIDWETGIWDAFQPLLMENGCEEVTRAKALEAFGGEEVDQESRTPSMPNPEIHLRYRNSFRFRITCVKSAREPRSTSSRAIAAPPWWELLGHGLRRADFRGSGPFRH